MTARASFPLRRRGFTLVELLVAIAVLAIVAVLGWRGLDGIVRSRQALTAKMEETRGIQLAFAQLQSDLEHVSGYNLVGQRPNLLADGQRMNVVRTVLAEGEPTRLQVVSYRIEGGMFTRRESRATRDLVQLDVLWQAALGDADPTPGIPLQAGVQAMTVRVWEKRSWRVLPSGTALPATANAAGLELALQLQNQEHSLVKTFLLGAQ